MKQVWAQEAQDMTWFRLGLKLSSASATNGSHTFELVRIMAAHRAGTVRPLDLVLACAQLLSVHARRFRRIILRITKLWWGCTLMSPRQPNPCSASFLAAGTISFLIPLAQDRRRGVHTGWPKARHECKCILCSEGANFVSGAFSQNWYKAEEGSCRHAG